MAIVHAEDNAPTKAPEITRKVLDNGLTVLIKPEPGSGLVAVEAIVKAGANQETIQTAGVGNFVCQLLLASTRLSSADEIAAVADEVGGNVESQWHEDFAEIRVITTSEMFNRATRLLGECLTDANFESKWVEKVRADLLRQVDQDTDDVFQKSYVKLRELLYEDNGYRRPHIGLRRTIKMATPQDLEKFYKAYYVPNNIVLSIVGDVTVKQALDRAEKMFAGMSGAKLPRDRGVPDESMAPGKMQATEADLPTAYLMLGWLAPGVTSEDYAAMTVGVNALGGGKGSMMFRELRQQRGMGYDLGVVFPKLRNQSHVVAYVITDPFKLVPTSPNPLPILDDVKSALLEQVDALRSGQLSDKDLRRAKGYTIGTFAMQQQRLMDRALLLGWFEAIGPGYETYWRFPDVLEKVTAADVQRVARKYLDTYAAYLIMPRTKSPSATTD
jgi:zinc protease